MNKPSLFRAMVKMPTHLGWRHWYDWRHFAGWRIQKNVLTGSFRVMNAKGRKVLEGTQEECNARLDSEKKRGLAPSGSHYVLLIPGLNNHPFFFAAIEQALRNAGYESMTVDYPSGHLDVNGHAERIAALIDRLEGVETLSFVTHSMGGLITRAMLDMDNNWFGRFSLGRIVMVAPPHKGSFFADLVYARPELRPLYEWVCGGVGYDLTSAGANALPDLRLPVGIIVGGSGRKYGFNPLAIEDNDGVVSVKSSLISTVTGFLQIKNWSHTLILWNSETIRQVTHYLETGRFDAPESPASAFEDRLQPR